MEKLKSYMVKFDQNSVVKAKIYLTNCIIEGINK